MISAGLLVKNNKDWSIMEKFTGKSVILNDITPIKIEIVMPVLHLLFILHSIAITLLILELLYKKK